MLNRVSVPLRNFRQGEGDCKCGCGKKLAPELLLRLQAFIYFLEAELGLPTRCNINSGARCIPHNTATYKGIPTPSFHVGKSRGLSEIAYEFGAAADIHVEVCLHDKWITVDKSKLAAFAIATRLFGGVGWKIYGDSQNFVHVDLGAVRTF